GSTVRLCSCSLVCCSFCFWSYGCHRDLHSFPTRRSSDLQTLEFLEVVAVQRFGTADVERNAVLDHGVTLQDLIEVVQWLAAVDQDRKSTRLNSSHVKISYAVFCLKKKKQLKDTTSTLVHR